MKEFIPEPAESTLVDGSFQIDIETIIEQIFGDLGGIASRSDIAEALKEVAPSYKDARIKTFVPIFLRRDAIQRLQSELSHHQGAKTPELENAA